MPAAKKRKPLPPGAEFEKIYKGKRYTLRVVRENGLSHFCIGKEKFRSPSGAARHVTGNDVNGWKFWGIEDRDRRSPTQD